MADPLVNLADLAEWMDTDVDSLPASAAKVLAVLSSAVRAESRQILSRATTTAVLYPHAGGYVTLPQRPVVSVAQVVGADTWTLRRQRLYVSACDAVTVTYTHGYAAVPDEIKGVILDAAKRGLTNPGGYRQQQVGSISVTWGAETLGFALSQLDRDVLARYRGGGVGVVSPT